MDHSWLFMTVSVFCHSWSDVDVWRKSIALIWFVPGRRSPPHSDGIWNLHSLATFTGVHAVNSRNHANSCFHHKDFITTLLLHWEQVSARAYYTQQRQALCGCVGFFFFFRDSCSIAGFAISAMGVRGGIQLRLGFLWASWVKKQTLPGLLLHFILQWLFQWLDTCKHWCSFFFFFSLEWSSDCSFTVSTFSFLLFFLVQYPHKSSSSTICLLSRSLVEHLAAKAKAFFMQLCYWL